VKRVQLGRDGMDVRRIETRFLKPRKKGNYQKTGLIDVLNVLSFGEHIILKGPKGAGKTLNIEQWAFDKDVPFMRYGCTGETGDRELLGGFTFKSLEESWFSLGVLTAAIDVANECGQCLLVLEEINALNEEAQKSVNSVADYRREVAHPSVGLVMRLDDPVLATEGGTVMSVEEEDEYRVNVVIDTADYSVPKRILLPTVVPGAKLSPGDALSGPAQLWVIGTMNPGYGGTYDLNEDFCSRFQFLDVQFMPEGTERDILYGQFPGRLSVEEKNYITGLQSLAKESRGGKFGYALSTRDLEQCVKAYLQFSAVGDRKAQEKALKLMEGKFPARHAADFQARVRSTFRSGFDLSQVTLY
jgi:MoxR-like ATPase